MSDEATLPTSDDVVEAGICRKPWRKPEVIILPVDQTANGATTGNDGGGNSTGLFS